MIKEGGVTSGFLAVNRNDVVTVLQPSGTLATALCQYGRKKPENVSTWLLGVLEGHGKSPAVKPGSD